MIQKCRVLVDSAVKVSLTRQPEMLGGISWSGLSTQEYLRWRTDWVRDSNELIAKIHPLGHLVRFTVDAEYEDRCSGCNSPYEEWVDPEDDVPDRKRCAVCNELVTVEETA